MAGTYLAVGEDYEKVLPLNNMADLSALIEGNTEDQLVEMLSEMK